MTYLDAQVVTSLLKASIGMSGIEASHLLDVLPADMFCEKRLPIFLRIRVFERLAGGLVGKTCSPSKYEDLSSSPSTYINIQLWLY